MTVVALSGSAYAQPVTIETTLGERGFVDGIVLHGQATSSVFVALPRDVPLTNGRLIIDGQSSTPTLQRGSFAVDVNGRPLDAIGLGGKDGAVAFQRTIALPDDMLSGIGAMNIRFDSDLRADTDPCRDDYDPANSVTVSPTSRIAFDVDIDRVHSIGDAVILLPHRPLVLLPAQDTVPPEIAAAALQLGILLAGQGREPRFDTVRGADAVAIRIGSAQGRAADTPSIRLERDGNKLDIVVDPGSDFIALSRMLQTVPEVLVGDRLVVSLGAAQPKTADEIFRAFPILPPAQRVKRYSDWRLNFPLLASNGRLTEAMLLKLYIAPDWSGERPIVTMYLNEQIVGAARPEPGQTDIPVAFPPSLLRFSNTLRVTLERATGKNYCAATDAGQAAQILPGSGLKLGDGTGAGFIRVASAIGREGQVEFPESAAATAAIDPYLRLASKILASFGTHAAKLSVAFGAAQPTNTAGTLRFEIVGPGGLVLSLADQIEARDLRYEVNSPLAVISAEDGDRTLLVQLSDAQNIPQPRSLYLGGGSKALVANSGVVWQNTAPQSGPSLAKQAGSIWQDIFSKAGIAVWVFSLLLVGLVLSSRAVIKAIFDRLRRTSGK
jgi:hypothetical protein